MSWKKWAFLLPLFILSACAQRVTVDTYTAPRLTDRGFPAGASFQILENDSVPNPVFDRSVKEKLEKLLLAKGFKIVEAKDASRADYVVDFAYDMTGREETRFHPQERTGNFYFTGTAGAAAVSAPMHFTTDMMETYSLFTAKLRIRVLTPPSRNSVQERTLWAGEVWTESVDRDMRSQIDYLAAAGINMLGKDSQKAKTITVRDDDPLLQVLKQNSLPA